MVLMLVRCLRGILLVVLATSRSGQQYIRFERPVMPALLKQLLQWLCPHRFSWPHCGIDGKDYQICLRCGTAFEYDLAKMHRTRRLVLPTRQ
jgi:hypothetical protein